MSIRKDIKITIFCAQSFDMFSKEILDTNPINLDLRPDGNATSADETAKKIIHLIKGGEDFTAITVRDVALNVIGLIVAEGLIYSDGIEIKYHDENTNELKTATYNNEGFLINWRIGYLSDWFYSFKDELL